MKKIYIKLKYKIYIIYLAFMHIPEITSGDLVWYEGKKYLIFNGTQIPSAKYLIGNNVQGSIKWVFKEECKKVKSFNNYLRTFKYAYCTYMESWFEIWVNSKLV